ncbi:hypothetical protein GGI07_004921 [Coemansia sp. Benny D115]|nr:hypothetical protein GGI07_004921 [Coemansia sp. Benny D115]
MSDLLAHVSAELVASSYNNSGGAGGKGAVVGAEGALRFVFTTSVSEDHEYLEGLQMYRQVLGVIGIVDCEASGDISRAQEEFMQVLARFPTAVAYRCLAFDPQADQADDVPGVTVVPNGDSSLSFYLQTLVSDFAGSMVSTLNMMAKSIEDRADLQTPLEANSMRSPSVASSVEREKTPLEGTIPQRSSYSSLQETGEAATQATAHRASIAGPAELQQRRESTHSLPAGRGRRGGEMDRDAVVPGSPVSVVTEKKQQKPTDTAGAGRLKKLQGDLYLQSGRLTEALSAYAASIEASRAVGDHLWNAVAMEGYCAALLLLCERQSERRLVAAFVAGIPDAAAPVDGNVSPQNADLGVLLTQIGSLFAQVPALYERCYTFASLLHAESCIRAALVLHATREALINDPEAALDSLVHQNHSGIVPRAQVPIETRDVVANTRNIPLRATINEWLQRGWASSFSALAFADQLETSAEISALFRNIGYSRKSFFFLRQFLLLAIPVLLRTSTSQRQAGAPLSAFSPGARPSMSSRTDHTALSAFPDGSSAFAAVSSAAAAVAASASTAAMHTPLSSPGHTRTSFDTAAGVADSPASLSREWFSKPRSTLRQAVIACLDALVYSFELGASHSEGEGWVHLQADVLRECLAIAEALPSYPHAIASAFRLVRCLSHLSSIVPESQRRPLFDEQHMLRAYIVRTIGLFHQRHHFDPSWSASNGGRESPNLASVDSSLAHRRVVGRDASVVGGVLDTLLVGVQFCTYPNNPPPIPVAQKTGTESRAARSLFLHNPSAQTQGDASPSLVAHEEAHFVATLANPFPFALPLSDITLIGEIDTPPSSSASGDQGTGSTEETVVSQSTQCILPAGSSSQILLVAVPRISGQLKVLGIKLTLFQHLTVMCILAEEGESDAKKRLKERPMRQRLEAERSSLLGLDKPLPDSPSVRLSAMNSGHSLLTQVVPALPKLSVIETSMAFEDSLSVYEGESRVVTLTLANSSEFAAADRLEVAFEPLPSLEGNKWAEETRGDPRLRDLTNAAFSYMKTTEGGGGDSSNMTSVLIKPQATYRLDIRVSGLSGLNGGEVVVRYGNSATAAWSRELRWPLRVSLVRLLASAEEAKTGATTSSNLKTKYSDLPPYIAHTLSQPGEPAVAAAMHDLVTVLREAFTVHRQSVKDKDLDLMQLAQDTFYLAELNLTNMGSTDVELTVETDLSLEPCDDVEAMLAGKCNPSALIKSLVMKLPGRRSLSRVVVPLPRVRLSDKVLGAAIPGLEADGGLDRSVFYPWRGLLSQRDDPSTSWVSGVDSRGNNRQFVLSKTGGISKHDLERRRKAFWYRQEICSRVRMRWSCHQSGRSGYIDPRSLFVLDESSMATVQPKGLDVQVLVGGETSCRVDTHAVCVQIQVGRPCDIEFRIGNKLSHDLDLAFGAWAIRDNSNSDEALLDDDRPLIAPGGANVGGVAAAGHMPLSLEQRAADRSLEAFVPVNGCTQSIAESSGLLSFQHTLEESASTDLAGACSAPRPTNAELPPLSCFDDIVFDDIQSMQLPPIAPGCVHSITLPLCVLVPGSYRIEYMISPSADSKQGLRELLFHEALVIDSNE